MSKMTWIGAMAIGAAVGSAAVAFMDSSSRRRKKCLRKNMGVMAKTVSNMIDAVIDTRR